MDERFDDFQYSEETTFSAEYSLPQMDIPPQTEHNEKKRKRGWLRTAILGLCCALVGSLLGSVLTLTMYQNNLAKESQDQYSNEVSFLLESRREVSQLETVPVDGTSVMTPAQVYAANVNSTVGITTSITTNFWGFQTTSAASGSGFIITNDGYILTNYHVVENSSSISVAMYDGKTYDAELIGYDESNDIAVLKIHAEDLVPVVLGDSDGLNVGDSVVAIGNPLGELTFSLTAGLVSAKDREVTLSSTVTMDLIQTDCAINSGNSGGALFNLYGEVIGITNAKYSSSSSSEASIDNIGFAIPINNVMGIVESIIEKGYIAKPYIGVSVTNVSTEAQAYGVPEGAAVQSVTDDGPAAQGGLQVGDVITHANGTAISGSSELVDLVGSCVSGDILILTVYRQGETMDLTITVGESIQSAKANEQTQSTQNYQGTYPPGSHSGRR